MCAGELPCRPGSVTMEAAMAAHAKRIEIVAEDRPVLEKWAGARATERRLVDRARIVLMAGEGRARRARSPSTSGARCRPSRRGGRGTSATAWTACATCPRPGRPLLFGQDVRARLIALACTRPPDTPEGVRRERWTHRELAEQVGMSESQAHEILRGADVRPHLTEYWVMSELGPDFDAAGGRRSAASTSIRPPTRSSCRSTRRPRSRPRQPARPDRLPKPGSAGAPRQRVHPQRHARTCSPRCRCTPAPSPG